MMVLMRQRGDVCLAFREKDTSRNYKRGVHCPLARSTGCRNSREVIAHLCVFMPNQAQQQAAPPCVLLTGKAEEAGGGRGGKMRGEEIVLAVIRRYLAVTVLVSLNS